MLICVQKPDVYLIFFASCDLDGLSRLPPVRLMSSQESRASREQQTTWIAEAKDRNGVIVDSNAPSSLVSTSTGNNSQTTTVGVRTGTGPALIISESSPLHDSSTSTQDIAPGSVVQLSPLSLIATSELPSILLSDTTLPAPDPSSSAHLSDTLVSEPSSQKLLNDKPTAVSSDVLLPMLIFSTVKSNPLRLVSNLLYLQRFRHRNAYSYSLDRIDGDGNGSGGEESFCLINMLAVAEFLENVDLATLGLATASIPGVRSVFPISFLLISLCDSSPSELSPIIIRNNPQTSTTPTTATVTGRSTISGVEGLQIPEGSFFLRGKVEQQVDAIAGSANKVISGVVDSSFGILRSLLPHNQTQSHVQAVSSAIPVDIPTASVNVRGVADANTDTGAGTPLATKVGQGRLGLLRRETGFSIANIAASIPSISRNNSKLQQEGEEGQQLMTVLRHSSIRPLRVADRNKDEESDKVDQSSGENDDDDDEDTSGDSEMEEEEDGSSDQEDQQETVIQSDQRSHPHPYTNPNSSVAKHANTSTGSLGADTRSIRSFESMLNDSKKRQKKKKLKRLAKDNEKIRKEEEKKTRIRDKERVKDKGEKNIKIVSIFADTTSSTPRKSLVDRLASVGARASGAKV